MAHLQMAASRSRKSPGTSGSSRNSRRRFVICLSNEGFAASLEVWKLYAALPDRAAAKVGMLRVIDESNEDYLYPRSNFVEIKLPRAVIRHYRPRRP